MSDFGTCPDCNAMLAEVKGKAYCPHCDEHKPKQAGEPE